jgi:TP901 family phage tail tape measure protein
MANYTSTANIVLSVNGKQAQKMLRSLEKDAQRLEKQIAKAIASGDKASMKKYQRELNRTNTLMEQLQGKAQTAEQVLRRLDKATPRELQKTLSTLQSQLNGIQRGSAAWDAQIAKIKLVKAEITKVNATIATQQSLWTKMNAALNTAQTFIYGAIAAVTGFIMAGRRAVNSFAEMEEAMANTRKYTRMTEENVLELNEAFKKMNTRMSRQELNLLAQEAGRLGKNTLDSVQQYVEAAAIIKVALVDLGDGATQTIAKISNIFGMEELYGVKDAMLKVGSTVNVLSQNCTASKPFIVEFAQRMAGVGSVAKMTIPEIMAFAATLDANGQKVEMSASAISRLVMKLFQDPAKIAKEVGLNVNYFTKVLQNDTTKGVMMFLEQLDKIGENNAIAALAPLFKDLGMDGVRMSQVLANLSSHLDMLKWEMKEANKAFMEGTSATKEYNIFNNTAQASIQKAKNHVHELAVELGEKLFPVMKHIYTSSSSFLRVLNIIISFLIEHKKIIGFLTGTIIAYYTAVGVAKTLQLAWNGAILFCKNTLVAFQYVVGLCEVAMIALTHGTKAAGTAFTFLNAKMKASPLGLITALIAGVAIAVINLRDKLKTFKDSVNEAVDSAMKWQESTIKEQNELDELFGKLQGASKGTKEYEDAKKSIINQYGEYLKGLIDEKGEIIDLARAYDLLTKAINRKAIAQGLKTAKEDVMQKYISELTDFANLFESTLKDYGLTTIEASKLTATVTEAVSSNKKIDKDTEDQIKKITAGGRKTFEGADNWWAKLKANGSSALNVLTLGAIGTDYRSLPPTNIVQKMYDLWGDKTEGMNNIDNIENGLLPLNKASKGDLELAIESLQSIVESEKAGNALVYKTGYGLEYLEVTVERAAELIKEYQEEITLRGSNVSPKQYSENEYESNGDGKSQNKTSKGDRFKREEEYKALREAYALINKSVGQKQDKEGKWVSYSSFDYQKEIDDINIKYYEKILQRSDLTWLERIQMQAKYQEALAKKEEDYNAQSIERENRTHIKKVVALKEQYAKNEISQEEYNKKSEKEDIRHLGVVTNIYKKQMLAKMTKWEEERDKASTAMYRQFQGNVDLHDRPVISAKKLTDAGWEGAGGENDIATVFSSQYGIEDAEGNIREILVTPILPDGSVLSPEELKDYIYNELQGASDILLADNMGIVIAVDVDPDGSAGEKLHKLQEIFYSSKPGIDLDAYGKFLQAKETYLNKENQISEKERKEEEKNKQEHQKELDKTKKSYFGQNKNEKKEEYDKEVNSLDEVYQSELQAVGNNDQEKLRIEEAYQIAKIALAKKYGQDYDKSMKDQILSFADWLDSDGGKALTGTMSTLTSGMSNIFSQLTSMMQSDLEIQTAAIEKKYDKEIELAEGNTYKEQKLEKEKEKAIAKAKQDANRKMFAMQVIQAVAQTAQNAISAYGSAAAIPITGFVMAPIAAAMAVAAGMLQIAAIKKQQQASEAQGYAEGGFTPDGDKYQEVGVVHAGEWVASQKLTKNPRTRSVIEMLDYAQRNNTMGAISAEDVSKSIVAPMVSANSQAELPTVINNNLYNHVAGNSELSNTISKLYKRLNEPFVTVNTVTGDLGIQKAQDEYAKLLKNKSPKSQK